MRNFITLLLVIFAASPGHLLVAGVLYDEEKVSAAEDAYYECVGDRFKAAAGKGTCGACVSREYENIKSCQDFVKQSCEAYNSCSVCGDDESCPDQLKEYIFMDLFVDKGYADCPYECTVDFVNDDIISDALDGKIDGSSGSSGSSVSYSSWYRHVKWIIGTLLVLASQAA